MKGKLVLVTGEASFISSHLVDTLLRKSAEARAADDFSSGKLKNLEYTLFQKGNSKLTHGKLTVYKDYLRDKALQGRWLMVLTLFFIWLRALKFHKNNFKSRGGAACNLLKS